ncbi:MAG: metallophosphoesterase [bacterium]|nr:metallophosphoesterase [bacterium]
MIYIFLLLFLLLLFYSRYIEPGLFIMREREMISLKIIKRPVSILHVSDLHLKGQVPTRLIRIIRKALKKGPDLILFTGDFTECDQDLAHLDKLLREFPDRIPRFAVLGNHEFHHYPVLHVFHHTLFQSKPRDIRPLLDLFKRHHIQVLRNQTRFLKTAKASFALTGMEYTDHVDPLPSFHWTGIRKGYFHLLFFHSPDLLHFFKKEDYDGIDLILMGHTHGGQVRLPLIGPVVTRTRYTKWIVDGYARRHSTFISSHRGLGQSFQFRFFCRPELVLLRIKPPEAHSA